MALYRIAYFMAKGFQLLRQNIFINLMAMGTVALSFLIFSVFFLVFQNLNGFLDLWEKRVQIIAYLTDGLAEKTIEEIRLTIVSMSQVETVRFVSKAEAMAILKRNLGDQDQILEGFSTDLLPASFEIQLQGNYRNAEATQRVVSLLKKIGGISDTQYGQQWIERFSVFMGIYRFSTILLGLLLSIAIAFIVSSAIKLSTHSRREELEIMKLVGANSSFIKIPFYIQGGFQGIVGSFVSLLILLVLYVLFLSELSHRLRFYNLFFEIHFLTPEAILSILVGGGLLGFLGSFFSLVRLKEN